MLSGRCNDTALLLGEFPVKGKSCFPQVLASFFAKELNLLSHPERVVRVSVLHVLTLCELQSFWVVSKPQEQERKRRKIKELLLSLLAVLVQWSTHKSEWHKRVSQVGVILVVPVREKEQLDEFQES